MSLPVVPAPAGAALAALRAHTSARHAQTEALLRLHEPFDRAHYGRILLGFDAFLAGWEPRVAAVLPPDLQAWFAQGRRHGLLQRDLQALGLAGHAPLQAVLPPLHTAAQALGSLYVMEGSALGGQVIAAYLRRQLDIGPEAGAAYFRGAGAGTMARWRAFQQLLGERLDADAVGTRAGAQAAAATFDALLATFEGLLHERAAA